MKENCSSEKMEYVPPTMTEYGSVENLVMGMGDVPTTGLSRSVVSAVEMGTLVTPSFTITAVTSAMTADTLTTAPGGEFQSSTII